MRKADGRALSSVLLEALRDLNRWLGGVYTIPAGSTDEDEDGEAAPQGEH